MPMLPTVNTVRWRDSLATLTCQNPLFKSIVEKYLDPHKGFYHLRCWRDGMGVLLGAGIQKTEVDAEPQHAIFLSDQHDSALHHRQLGRPYGSSV